VRPRGWPGPARPGLGAVTGASRDQIVKFPTAQAGGFPVKRFRTPVLRPAESGLSSTVSDRAGVAPPRGVSGARQQPLTPRSGFGPGVPDPQSLFACQHEFTLFLLTDQSGGHPTLGGFGDFQR
jgi:hypothetical protein